MHFLRYPLEWVVFFVSSLPWIFLKINKLTFLVSLCCWISFVTAATRRLTGEGVDFLLSGVSSPSEVPLIIFRPCRLQVQTQDFTTAWHKSILRKKLRLFISIITVYYTFRETHKIWSNIIIHLLYSLTTHWRQHEKNTKWTPYNTSAV